MKVEHVQFTSSGYTLSGTLYPVDKGAPTLLLLHGLSFYSFEYERLAPLLQQEGYNCFAFDFRSHGRSEGPRGKWTLAELVEDTLHATDYLEKRGFSNFGLFGNSLGATVAVYAAAQDPRIKSVVASNCATKPSVALFSPFRRMLLECITALTTYVPFRLNISYFIPYKLVLSDSEDIRRVKSDKLISSARRICPSTYLDMYHWDATKPASTVSSILVLRGKHDRLQPPEQSQLLFEASQDPKQLMIMDTGHIPQWQNPELLAAALHRWFGTTLPHN